MFKNKDSQTLVRKPIKFRLFPEYKTLYTRVFIYKTLEDMHFVARQEGMEFSDKATGLSSGFIGEYASNGRLVPCFSEIFLSEEFLTHEIVSHELSHAVCQYARRRKISFSSITKFANRGNNVTMEEEWLCYIQGYLIEQFYLKAEKLGLKIKSR